MDYEKDAANPPNYDNGHVSPDEKGIRRLSIGHVSENREDDFLTRNGLTLRSFKRSTFLVHLTLSRDLTAFKGPTMHLVWACSITP